MKYYDSKQSIDLLVCEYHMETCAMMFKLVNVAWSGLVLYVESAGEVLP